MPKTTDFAILYSDFAIFNKSNCKCDIVYKIENVRIIIMR
jgi:hypothetical protein